jgi:transposase
MSRRSIPVNEINEVLYQWQQGHSKSAISRRLGMSRPTVRRHISAAVQLGLSTVSSPSEVASISFELQERLSRSRGNDAPAREDISALEAQIVAFIGQPDMTIRQMWRLFQGQGHTFSESSLKRYIRQTHSAVSAPVTIRMETEPGQQAQVDFGQMKVTFADGSTKRLWAFVMSLSYSRHRFVRFVQRQDITTWLKCHIRAFEFFGGVPHTVMVDNLKSGVVKADIYDPVVNRAYAECERHYQFVVDPNKVRTPQHKGKVERIMTVIRQQLLSGREFDDVAHLNESALAWCREVAGRIHGTTRRTPQELFTLEQPQLRPLPAASFDLPTWAQHKAHPDCHIVFERSYYSVPYRYVGQQVWVRGGIGKVQIFHKEDLIKIHPRASHPGEWLTDPSDYPEGKQHFLSQHPEYCQQKARQVGPNVHKVIETVLAPGGLVHLRKAQSILRLAEKYGAKKLDLVCEYILEHSTPHYRSIKSLLENGIPQPRHNLREPPPLSREAKEMLHSANSFGEVTHGTALQPST